MHLAGRRCGAFVTMLYDLDQHRPRYVGPTKVHSLECFHLGDGGYTTSELVETETVADYAKQSLPAETVGGLRMM